jgi:phytol kinase
MIGPLIGIGGVSLVLLAAEYLWQTNRFHKAEVSRKFVHILAGVFIASWAFFMPFWLIRALSLLLLMGVFVTKRLRLFNSIHHVSRPTYGTYLFPIGIWLSALFATTDWVYVAAILHLSLADGFAALVGTRFLKHRKHKYNVFGQPKTIMGTATFYVFSLLITAAVVLYDQPVYNAVAMGLIFWLPLSTTLLENLGVYGTDNVLIPMLVVIVLNTLQTIA